MTPHQPVLVVFAVEHGTRTWTPFPPLSAVRWVSWSLRVDWAWPPAICLNGARFPVRILMQFDGFAKLLGETRASHLTALSIDGTRVMVDVCELDNFKMFS